MWDERTRSDGHAGSQRSCSIRDLQRTIDQSVIKEILNGGKGATY